MTTFGPQPGGRDEGALFWEGSGCSCVAVGLNSPVPTPSPLLPPFPLCHHLPRMSLITGVLCHSTRLHKGTWDLLKCSHQGRSLFRDAPAGHPCVDPPSLSPPKPLGSLDGAVPLLCVPAMPNSSSALESELCLLASTAVASSPRLGCTAERDARWGRTEPSGLDPGKAGLGGER